MFVFIFVGVRAFTGTGTVGAIINSILVRRCHCLSAL
jgi:hypothetical protein